MGRRCAQFAGNSLADWASRAIHRFPRPYGKVVGWNAGADAEMIQAAQSERLARDESVGANPEFCQGLQITLVSTGDCVFLASLDAKHVLSRGPRLNLFNEGTVHQHGSVYAYKSVGFQLFRHRRNRFSE